MPIAPSGTRPISTWRRDSTSQSSEPTPMPTENTTSSSEATCSSPCSTAFAKRRELGQEGGAEEPHPRDAEERAEDDEVAVGELQVAPRLGDRVPVDDQRRVGRRRRRHRLRRQPAEDGDADAGVGDVLRADPGHGDEQAAGEVAEQDGDEGAHLDHAVAAGELALAEVLRQVGELDRAEQRRVQAHQEDAGEQERHVGANEAPGGERHDRDLEPLDEADQARLVELVGELAARRREQQERQDEERADHQPGRAPAAASSPAAGR